MAQRLYEAPRAAKSAQDASSYMLPAGVIMDTGLLNLLNENPPIDVNVPSIFDVWLNATVSAMVDFHMA